MIDEEKEYFARFPNLTILPFVLWALIIGFVIAGVLYASKAAAEPIARAEGENGAVITLYTDPCDLRGEITNLPFKAVWEEQGKVFKGCWGPRPDLGIVGAYFNDKTVAIIPVQLLKRLAGA